MKAHSALERNIDTLVRAARASSIELATISDARINRALKILAGLLTSRSAELQTANRRDLAAGKRKGLSSAMLDRLTLSPKALQTMVSGVRTLTRLSSGIGDEYDARTRPNGLQICKRRVPIGVVAIIYESRPNVTVDSAAICLKSRNAVILRGGSEAFHSNVALTRLFAAAMQEAGLPENCVQLVPTTDRAAIDHLLVRDDCIDLVIPRGGEGLIRAVVDKSRIPVIKHYKGVCHVFISRHADMSIALPIAVNAKVQRPGVCNAMETLLVDSALPRAAQERILDTLIESGVSLIGDRHAASLRPAAVTAATEQDWYEEYLDLRLAVRFVNGLNEAIAHINTYGSRHTDSIVSRSKTEIDRFLAGVDSSSVMANASTRFSDGGEYGMGCEIGISTDKLHSRGPMGLTDLTTYKWIVRGNGQVRG